MIRRLVEVNYDEGFATPSPERIHFWLRELRTPRLLLECVGQFPEEAARNWSGCDGRVTRTLKGLGRECRSTLQPQADEAILALGLRDQTQQ